MTYFSIEAIKQANRARGHHFFERGTMRFFRSRIAPGIIGGCYFITSEQFDATSARLYTVRRANEDGSIDTVSEFQEFGTLAAARKAARLLADADYAAWRESVGA